MTDNATRKKTLERLEAAGWKIGSVTELLNLTPADEQIINAALLLRWATMMPTTEDATRAYDAIIGNPKLLARIRELDAEAAQ